MLLEYCEMPSELWHHIKLADSLPGGNVIAAGLYHRKSHLGGLHPAVGFEITFDAERTIVRRVQVADVADLAGHLSVRQRMAHLLRRGAMSAELIADEIETVKRTARRYRQQFTVLQGGKLALLERRTA